MKFCPKCRSLMKPKKVKGKVIFVCSCGYTDEKVDNLTIKEEISEKKGVEVVEKDIETRPTLDAECPRCKNSKAYYHLVQTRAADEPETKFLQCTKCGKRWRDYS